MLKKLCIITTVLFLQIVTFGQSRTVIHQPLTPIPVNPYPARPQPIRPPVYQQGKWFYIATTEVRLSGERDVVNINGRDIFRAIKFKVSLNPVEVYDLNVVFDNGQFQKFSVRNVLNPGTESRILNFTGNYRRIKSIVITYRTRGNFFSQRAHVVFYGMR